ncbi:MAG: exodeoxyribonuclease VII large subunit [Neisseria sp.]|nr:exodeoxyribonuclease VII large subunit [Neisseria sp.]
MFPTSAPELFAPTAVSVSELNARARDLLENHFVGFWVAGEVSNLTRAASGHLYFSLKDANAQVRCAMFRHTAARFGAIKEGDQIEVAGKISLYEARGEFQITVNEVRLKGLGRLYEAYERLKNQLQAEGMFAAERKKAIPHNPRAIGIVTSPAAAALRDVVSTLKRRAPHIPIMLYPCMVQGVGSAEQIAQAVQTAATRAEVDVLIVCRGGGSIEDLWSFNEEIVVREIAAANLPIVSGVGHETDFTLCDFVADLRAPTPTAAAELVSPDRMQALRAVQQLQQQLHHSLQKRYQNAAQKLDWLSQNIRHPAQNLQQQKEYINLLKQQLHLQTKQQIRFKQQLLQQEMQALQYCKPNIEQAQAKLQQLQTAWRQNGKQLLQHKRHQLEKQASILAAVSPQQILERGFAVVRNTKGKVIRDAHTLKTGQKLQLTFADGQTDVQVCKEQAQADLFDFS